MHFHQPHNRKSYSGKKSRVIFYLLGIFVVAALFYYLSFPSGSYAFVVKKTWEVRNSFFANLIAVSSSILVGQKKLAIENQNLKKEIIDLKKSEIKAGNLEKENERLRKFFGLKAKGALVVASVLSKPPFALPDTLVLDSITGQPLSNGDLVFDSSGVLMGEIVLTNDAYSVAKLFSSAGNINEGALASGEHISLEGRGGGGFFFEVPKGFYINKGEIIYIDGSPVAKVSEVITKKNDPFIDVYLESLISPQSVSMVGIMRR